MTEDDKQALKEILVGSLPILILLAIAFSFIFALRNDQTDLPRFEVVDRHNDCDVVRWVSPSNNFHYFLDCRS